MIKLKNLAALLLSGAICASFAFAFTACADDDAESGSQNSEQAEGTGSGGKTDDEGQSSGNNSDASGAEEAGGGSYYGVTYAVDFETLDYYVDGSISEEAKTEYTSAIMSGSTITITLQEDGTGACIWTAYDGRMELDISFDYTAVECTQISYTSTSSLNDTYFFDKTFLRDFSGVQFEFSNFIITKIMEGGADFADQLSAEEMEEIGSEYMNICAYGYDGSDMVIYFAEEGFGEWAQYYYEEATGYYYYRVEGENDFYCEVTGEYISDKDTTSGYTYGAEYQYNESEVITAYGALTIVE